MVNLSVKAFSYSVIFKNGCHDKALNCGALEAFMSAHSEIFAVAASVAQCCAAKRRCARTDKARIMKRGNYLAAASFCALDLALASALACFKASF